MNETRKRVVSIAFVMMCVTSVALFAQTSEYTTLLNKAKEYESKKEYVYALGFYYDAMACDAENAQEAYDRYIQIYKAIKEGKPGLGKFNEFEMHDSWFALLRNAEKYWTEYPPYAVVFSEMKKGDVDFATRTATYTIDISLKNNQKYASIMDNCLLFGFRKSYRKDWSVDIPETWPVSSVNKSTSNKYLQDGAALYVSDNKTYNAWKATQHGGVLKSTFLGMSWTGEEFNLYDLKFAIVDESEKDLLTSSRHLIQKEKSSYTFSGVPANVMSLIDDGKIKIQPTELYLEYGRYNKNDATDDGRSFIKNFPEVKYSKDKISYYTMKPFSTTEALCAPVKVYKPNEMVFVEGGDFTMGGNYGEKSASVESFYISKYEITQAEWQNVMMDNPSNFQKGKSDDFSLDGQLNEVYPIENINWYDAIVYCNKRSILEGLEPCYSIDGDVDKVTFFHLGLINNDSRHYKTYFENIVCDFDVKGYRLPTETEWEYAAKGGKKSAEQTRYSGSDDLYEVAWWYENSNKQTHEVGLKKPNALGLYDMSGNVSELCWDKKNEYSPLFGLRGGSYKEGARGEDEDLYISYPREGLYGGFRVVRNAK